MDKRRYFVENDWALVIKAQDDMAKKVISDELSLKHKKKQLYKEELDQQIQHKKMVSQEQVNKKNEELNFYNEQQIAIKELEARKKNLSKNIKSELSACHEKKMIEKKNHEIFVFENELKKEKNYNKKIVAELEDEKLKELVKKHKKILAEKEEIRKKDRENNEKKRIKSLEKIQDRLMIEEKMKQMEENEHKSDIARRGINSRRKNVSSISVINTKDNNPLKEPDWVVKIKEMKQNDEKDHKSIRIQKQKELQEALESQIIQKKLKDNQEKQTDKNYLQIAKIKAREEQDILAQERFKKIEKQKGLKDIYDKQLEERNKRLYMELSMSPQEVGMHKDILQKVKSNHPVDFLSVPGSSTNETPVKRRLVYVKNDNINYSSFTPPPRRNFSDNSKARNLEVYPDPYKHNPVTNPIGSDLYMQNSSRRGIKAKKRLSIAGNFILNQ